MKSKLRWSTGGPGSDFIDVLLNSYEKTEKAHDFGALAGGWPGSDSKESLWNSYEQLASLEPCPARPGQPGLYQASPRAKAKKICFARPPPKQK